MGKPVARPEFQEIAKILVRFRDSSCRNSGILFLPSGTGAGRTASHHPCRESFAMKYPVSVVLSAGLVLALVASNAEAAAPKPIAVLSLTSHQNLSGGTEGIGELAKVSDLPTWLASMLRLFDEGKGASGLDAKRPWGVVLQLGDGLSAYGFVPIRDAEYLLWDLDEHIDSTEEVGWEVYRVTGTEVGKQLYARVSGDWIYVAECREDLNDVASDPASLLGGLDKKYDAAFCLETVNIPAKEGEAIIRLLGEKLGPVLREHASDQALNFLGEALYASEQITMGWGKH